MMERVRARTAVARNSKDIDEEFESLDMLGLLQ